MSKSSLVLWLLLFIMAGSTKGNSKVPIDPKDETFQNEANRIKLLYEELISVKDQVRNDIRKNISEEEEKTEKVLKSLPKRCQLQKSSNFQKSNTAVAVERCDALHIFEDVLFLAARTTNFTFGLITDGALIVADFSSCLNQFNPISIIRCLYYLFRTVPNQIRAVIEDTKYFTASVKVLVPEIYHGLKSCFGHGLADYSTKLNSVVRQVAACSNKPKLSQE